MRRFRLNNTTKLTHQPLCFPRRAKLFRCGVSGGWWRNKRLLFSPPGEYEGLNQRYKTNLYHPFYESRVCCWSLNPLCGLTKPQKVDFFLPYREKILNRVGIAFYGSSGAFVYFGTLGRNLQYFRFNTTHDTSNNRPRLGGDRNVPYQSRNSVQAGKRLYNFFAYLGGLAQ